MTPEERAHSDPLLTCPFCGSDDQQMAYETADREGEKRVECADCGACGPWSYDIPDRRWNARHGIREAVAEERERCARAAYEWGERAQSRYAQAELRLLSDHLGKDLQ